MRLTVFDAKQYDRAGLNEAANTLGVSIEFNFISHRLSHENVFTAKGSDAICIFVNDKVDREIIDILEELGIRHIITRSAGTNHIDLVYAKSKFITVSSVPSYSPHAVAEHAVALLMCLNRKIHKSYQKVGRQDFTLDGLLGIDIHDKVVGVVATGKIGKIFAQIMRGFGCRVLAFDTFPEEEWAKKNGVDYTDLAQLVKGSDIISIHSPLTSDSVRMLNKNVISTMRDGAIIINVSRGGLIDTVDLLAALDSGKLAGAALDVYENESEYFFEDWSKRTLHDQVLSRLIKHPRVLLTSHQAFFTREALAEIYQTSIKHLLNIKI